MMYAGMSEGVGCTFRRAREGGSNLSTGIEREGFKESITFFFRKSKFVTFRNL